MSHFNNHPIIIYLFNNYSVLRNTNKLDLFGFDILIDKISSSSDKSLITDDYDSDEENIFFIKFIHPRTPTVHSGSCAVNKNTIIQIFHKMFDLAIILYSKNYRDEF